MGQPFNHWTDRIISVEDDASKRTYCRIIRWRAKCLSDISKQRDAAYALARLYMLRSAQPGGAGGANADVTVSNATDVSEEWHVATAFRSRYCDTEKHRHAGNTSKVGIKAISQIKLSRKKQRRGRIG